MPYLEPTSLSPDPLYGRDGLGEAITDGEAAGMCRVRLGPWRVLEGDDPRITLGASERDPWSPAGMLTLHPQEPNGARVLLDFGSELEGELELELEAAAPATIFASFGESLAEAMAWGLPPAPATGFAAAKEQVNIPAGRSRHVLTARGFRFVRIDAFDGAGRVSVGAIARARFAGGARQGDLRCSDARFQRLWQSSVYTARLCARPRAFWDGVKRDRHGWYGDARITQQTYDAVFIDPVPAERMLLDWPVGSWANGIPAFSFDAVAMFRQLLLAHGQSRPAVPEIWLRLEAFMAWVLGSQVDEQLRLVRRDGVEYFFGIGFIDWSPQPLGGRFEELPWLQCAWCESLALAADIARWLGHQDRAEVWSRARTALGRLIRGMWRDGGYPHTLERATEHEVWAMPHTSDLHHRLSYLEGCRWGPSRPSRHAVARAAAAGMLDDPDRKRSSLAVLEDPSIPGIITPFYQFYEQSARARLGDAEGALRRMVDYLADMLMPNDGSTVWESFEPEVTGFARWSLHGFPKSLCHGWGSGLVPLSARWLYGVEALAPGYGEIALHPPASLPMAFSATIPTPSGPLRIEREDPTGPLAYHIPEGCGCGRLDGAEQRSCLPHAGNEAASPGWTQSTGSGAVGPEGPVRIPPPAIWLTRSPSRDQLRRQESGVRTGGPPQELRSRLLARCRWSG